MGQLIFSTHESNLLDQEFLGLMKFGLQRKPYGSTKLYSLSDFKRTQYYLILEKVYLNGKIWSYPFLGNLQDLH